MATTKEAWGSKKNDLNLRDLAHVLGHMSNAMIFIQDWTDICKRLNPTATNITRQDDCKARFDKLFNEGY